MQFFLAVLFLFGSFSFIFFTQVICHLLSQISPDKWDQFSDPP
jgi:hypothetical protein